MFTIELTEAQINYFMAICKFTSTGKSTYYLKNKVAQFVENRKILKPFATVWRKHVFLFSFVGFNYNV